ncbi:MAG: S8 family serine peptidase [Lachnospiraceae bacterium]|nr:S8 family serine peptidase [Lachnospiraceae bacterium]
MKRKKLSRLLSFALAASLAGSLCTVSAPASPGQPDGGDSAVSLEFEEITDGSVSAQLLEGTEADGDGLSQEEYGEEDIVRVSIVLEEASTVEAGYSIESIADDEEAVEYREELRETQDEIVGEIEEVIDGELDVVRNLTLAANLVSANVEYGQIDVIADVDGVEEIYIENCYEPTVVGDEEETSDPQMATSSSQIGSSTAWEEGYTGAGSRIAVIDTGIDTDHQSFDGGALEYSLSLNAEEAGVDYDAYVESLDLLDADEIAEKLDQLNAYSGYYTSKTLTLAEDDVYYTAKIAFGYNYIDESLDITHDNDSQGEHGSHVEGIAAANACIPDTDSESGYTDALDAVNVQGVAPDAQILSLKVFGSAGGAYDSDIFAAIEDAIILEADAINLSLGSSYAGFSTTTTTYYQAILDSLTEAGAVVCMSAGNAYDWTYYSSVESLYAEDVSFDTVGYPGSYTNSLAVASVANAGSTGNVIRLADGTGFGYTEYTSNSSTGETFGNPKLTTIAGEWEYVYINGFGTEEQFALLADVIKDKIVVVNRGGSLSFATRANYAYQYGAAGLIVANNQSGTLAMNLSGFEGDIPVVSVTQASAELLRTYASEPEENTTGVGYSAGTLTIEASGTIITDSDYYTMSSFSSWGIPGSLELKPEITAPGGTIYSVDGSVAGGTSYETMSGTSMASPQVAGMAAVAAQYIRENSLEEETGLSARQLAQSLLCLHRNPCMSRRASIIPC